MLDILQRAAIRAGELSLKYYQQINLKTTEKANEMGLVTVADTESQRLIKEIITKSLLKLGIPLDLIGFIGEEGLVSNPKARHLFIIDPLDGTSNFARGDNNFCISIAYVLNQQIKTSVIYHPPTKSLYYAEVNRGAFKEVEGDRVRLQIQAPPFLSDSSLAYNLSSSPIISSKVKNLVSRLSSKVRKIDKTSSCILTALSVIENRFHLAINGRCFLWDIAALALIVKESGAMMTNWRGQQLTLNIQEFQDSYEIIVAASSLIQEI
jgi:myo-inositol-1(or 4)-monophosphatase